MSWRWSTVSLSSFMFSIVAHCLVVGIFALLEMRHLFAKCINSRTISLLHKLKSDRVISGKIESKNTEFYQWCKEPYIIFYFLVKTSCKRGLWLWSRWQTLLSQVISHTYKNIKFLIIQQTSNSIRYNLLHS